MSSKSKGKPFRKFNPKKSKVAENPFDKFANSKKKHEVLNRRVKGEDRNVGRARERAIEDRKTKLMADYKSSQKSNVFADRRFGEGDANLSLEEKMFMRFQKEKMTKVKKSAKFNLDESEEVTLTHQGKALSEYTTAPPSGDWDDADDEDDENLGRDVVNTLHFGGGFQPTGKATDDEGAFKKFDSRDALQEIVMKSKLAKLEKREAKDAQEESRVTLDSAYEDLISSAMLDFKPTKRDRSEDVESGKQDPNAVNYDSSLRAMAFESRAQPTDRTKSKEEVAVAELKRLEELEADRQRRMRAADPEDALIKSALKEKNITGKKKKRATDDDIDDLYLTSGGHNRERDDSDDSDSDESDSGDEIDEFGNSHGILDKVSDDEEEEEEEEEDEDVASGSEEEDDDEDEEEEEEEEDNYSSEDDKKASKKGSSSAVTKSNKSSSSSESTSSAAPGKSKSKGKGAAEVMEEAVNRAMPHILHCPTSLEDFDVLLNDFVLDPREDLPALLSRVMTSSSVHLPATGTSKATNMSKMSIFLDILFVHFIRVGDSLVDVMEEEDVECVLAQVHCLSAVIFQLAQDVPDACRVSAVKLIKNMHANLQRRMRL